jgi:hypothetical protein
MEIEIAARDLSALDGIHRAARQINRPPGGRDASKIALVDGGEHPLNDDLSLMDEVQDFMDIAGKRLW